MTDTELRLAAANEQIAKLRKAIDDANRLIFAVGAPLGSSNYFAIRTILSDALK